MGTVRACAVLAGFAVLTVPLLPVQSALLRLSPRWARTFPHWYHRQVCRILGVRLHIEGEVSSEGPVLIVANHSSWLDIPVLSALAPVSFISKKEVAGWPGVSLLARLQQTVFVDRERRVSVGDTTNEIRRRLARGDALVLFAEGTSSDGNRVLPFRSSLFASAIPSRRAASGGTDAFANTISTPALVQTVTLAYTRLHGVPIERADRAQVAWYGDMEMLSHAWNLLKSGPLDVVLKVGPPMPVADFENRKAVARQTEEAVRAAHVRILGHAPRAGNFETVRPQVLRSRPLSQSKPPSGMR